jgi:hypothetical protein
MPGKRLAGSLAICHKRLGKSPNQAKKRNRPPGPRTKIFTPPRNRGTFSLDRVRPMVEHIYLDGFLRSLMFLLIRLGSFKR